MNNNEIKKLIKEQEKLLNEFERYKAIHKYAILKAKIIDYYRTMEQGQVNIPDFMRYDSPEKLADRDIKNILINNTKKFNKMYELAYADIAPKLD